MTENTYSPAYKLTVRAIRDLIEDDTYACTFQSLGQYRGALLRQVDSLYDAGVTQNAESGAPSTITAEQITAGAAVLGDDGKPVGRNTAMMVYDAMCAENLISEVCTLPPPGWYCARPLGHDGPCAAHPVAKPEGEAPHWGPVRSVGNLVRNLMTLEQDASIVTAFHIDLEGKRRCRAQQGITVSRERVIDGRWIDSTRKDVPHAYVLWARPDERAQQAATPGALLAILRDVHDTLSSESDSDIDYFEDDDEEREGAPVQFAARKVMEVMDIIKATAHSAPDTLEAPRELPPLPTPTARMYSQNGYRRASVSAGKGEPLFAADQMQDYARAARLDGG